MSDLSALTKQMFSMIGIIDFAEIFMFIADVGLWIFFVHLGRKYLRDREQYLSYINTYTRDAHLHDNELELIDRYRKMTPAQQHKTLKYMNKLLTPKDDA